ncbi:MAG: YHYH protein [Methylobacterium sp.]|jgi:hypothetical protein|nr:YHYH protein [Methylobacterium sp.]MCA3635182.1 YHYH protein [Methylobacterium sp.]MCA3645425.1 YHYH protein [Methylobacterium sp.]MCA3651836.1 YHYH protein [Methylobacterium sp.]MCA4922054.1 YHYH protein [Methylobacterium sp.]
MPIGRSLLALCLALPSLTAMAHELPLGDGKISNVPKRGHVMSCRQSFRPDAPGAHRRGEWIGAQSWNSAAKPAVQGSVSWPGAIEILEAGNERRIQGNGLPTNHPTGIYPIAPEDPAFYYDRNPNGLQALRVNLKLPLTPQLAQEPGCLPMGPIGYMLTGVAMFHALDLAGRDAPAHEILDRCDGHPERSGHYHYHRQSPCQRIGTLPGGHSALAGYALDGFGIFGPKGENGRTLTNADLDECHGHTHRVLWDGKAVSIYHYHLTAEFPYSIGCFRGFR